MPVQWKQYVHFSDKVGSTWMVAAIQLFYHLSHYFRKGLNACQTEFVVKKYTHPLILLVWS